MKYIATKAFFNKSELCKWNILLLKRQCPGVDILLIASSVGENWCYYIWSQCDQLFSRYHGKIASTAIDVITT